MTRKPSASRDPRRRARTTRVIDIWHQPAPLPEMERVSPPTDVTALLRSLGDPPLAGTTDAAIHFAIVIERAAALAAALALSADLLAESES
jgi:hypothetical protein